MTHDLPPLPEGTYPSLVEGWGRVYTAAQMREYALEAIREHEERRKESQERSAKFNAEQIASYGRSR